MATSMQLGTGKGHSNLSQHKITHGFSLVRGTRHGMEDFHVAEFRCIGSHELGLFAIYDGHSGDSVAHYLQHNLFDSIVNEPGFWEEPISTIMNAYERTDSDILGQIPQRQPGGSTAVTAILIDGNWLLVANVGDSRAVLCRQGVAVQLSIDHDPISEKEVVESKGGFVTQKPGHVPRVDGRLAFTRSFGDKRIKEHLSSTPHVREEWICDDDEFLILASDGLWTVISNQEAVDLIKNTKDPENASKQLTSEAVNRESIDDISCIVVRF